MKHQAASGKKHYTRVVLARLHHAADAQNFLSSFQNALAVLQRQLCYEKKQLLEMECVVGGSIEKI